MAESVFTVESLCSHAAVGQPRLLAASVFRLQCSRHRKGISTRSAILRVPRTAEAMHMRHPYLDRHDSVRRLQISSSLILLHARLCIPSGVPPLPRHGPLEEGVTPTLGMRKPRFKERPISTEEARERAWCGSVVLRVAQGKAEAKPRGSTLGTESAPKRMASPFHTRPLCPLETNRSLLWVPAAQRGHSAARATVPPFPLPSLCRGGFRQGRGRGVRLGVGRAGRLPRPAAGAPCRRQEGSRSKGHGK